MDVYGVIGNPINHSKSPKIHLLFGQQVDHDIYYQKIPATDENFIATTERFFTEGGKGLNITVPFKEKAFQLADSLSKNAQICGSVNTFTFSEDGRIHGESTDGIGLIIDLKNNQISLENTRILILGAGGATRGIIPMIFASSVGSVVLCNRTMAKAELLQEEFLPYGEIICQTSEQLSGKFDLIINATSASLSGQIPDMPDSIIPRSVCYDLSYSYGDTPFQRWTKQNNSLKSLQGWGMLVEQAAESFYIWRGVRPKTKEIIQRLQTELEN
ncbi:MAG: shikimate dehydrogenase [Gammaproteobacteria bacterium]|nr:shikimate dehydrogenase [Gammaproteobacteria bacterium]|tara:strand:+ start:12573 stop:13388 length:816 start_codon:yes stop_codon:yes gene_type:complete